MKRSASATARQEVRPWVAQNISLRPIVLLSIGDSTANHLRPAPPLLQTEPGRNPRNPPPFVARRLRLALAKRLCLAARAVRCAGRAGLGWTKRPGKPRARRRLAVQAHSWPTGATTGGSGAAKGQNAGRRRTRTRRDERKRGNWAPTSAIYLRWGMGPPKSSAMNRSTRRPATRGAPRASWPRRASGCAMDLLHRFDLRSSIPWPKSPRPSSWRPAIATALSRRW